MQVFFNQLFDNNYYGNKEPENELVATSEIPSMSVSWFNHIWNNKILGNTAEYALKHEHSKEDWENIHCENQRHTFEIITNAEDFDARVKYQNSEGRSFANNLKDILFHVLNHSSHQRGQIAADLRTNEIGSLAWGSIIYKS